MPNDDSETRSDARPGDYVWRNSQAASLLRFGEGAALAAGGFGYLDDEGTVDPHAVRELYITARMTHVYSLAALQDPSDGRARALAKHGAHALRTIFHDKIHDGWFNSLDATDHPHDDTKTCYGHAFVLLAAASAAAAQIEGASDLLKQAQEVVAERFWRQDEGRCAESFQRDWSGEEQYRGANSNMHAVESFISCADVSGDQVWRERALSIAEHLIAGAAASNNWRLPEHFDAKWTPDLQYNSADREHRFRPFGFTPGHALEWARLLVCLHAGSATPAEWLLPAARRLFEDAVAVGWAADGQPGFVYTLDWQDQVVTETRMSWVLAEAILAADAVGRATGKESLSAQSQPWWNLLDQKVIDHKRHSSWNSELNPSGQPTQKVWSGKPDIYHFYQLVIFPDLPLAPCAAAALVRDNRA